MASNNRNNRGGRHALGEQEADRGGSSGTSRNPEGGASGPVHGQETRSADNMGRDYTDAATERQGRTPSSRGSTSRSIYVSRGGQRRDARPTLHEVEELVPPASESAERRERESSPSAVSESSSVRLEWDSSADVGSLPVTVNDGSIGRAAGAGRNYSLGLSSLERIAYQLSSGSSGASNIEHQIDPPTRTTLNTTSASATGQAESTLEERRGRVSSSVTKGPPPTFFPPKSVSKKSVKASGQRNPMAVWMVGRSHSQEEEHEHGQSLERVKSVSMIELATAGRVGDQPILLQPSAISNIKNRNKRETSSRDSVSTVLSSKMFDKNKPENEEDLGRAHSTPSSSPITAVSPAHSPVPSSVPAMATSRSLSNPSSEHQQPRSREKRRSKDPVAQGRESSDDMEVATRLEEDKENTQNLEVSEASTDWEYGSRSHTPNESSLSDWQHSGVTQSEVKYKSKIQVPSKEAENSSAYSLTVEMPKSRSREIEPQKNRHRNVTARIQQSKGVQTEDFIPTERGQSTAQGKSEKGRKGNEPLARISRSVQIHKEMLDLERTKSGTESTNGIKTDSSSSSKNNGRNGKQHESKNGADRKERSTNTEEEEEESRHRGPRYYRDKTRARQDARREDMENAFEDRKDEVESLLQEFVTSEEDLRNVDDAGSLSSEMSATCLKIQELLKTHPFRGKLLELVFAHHLSHLRALKKDIRRVRQMNRIVVQADQRDLQEEADHYNSTTTSSSEDTHLKLGKQYYKQLEKAIETELSKQTDKKKTHHRIPEVKLPLTKRHLSKRRQEYSEQIQRESPHLHVSSSSSSAATYSINNGKQIQTNSNRTSPEDNSEALAFLKPAQVAGTHARRQTHSAPPKTNSAKKLDQLQRTCDIITDLLILNQGLEPLPKVASSQFQMQTCAEQVYETYSARTRDSHGKHRRQTSSGAERGRPSVRKTSHSKSKQAFSFFVAFPNCKPCNGFEASSPQDPSECPGKTLQEAFQENHPDVLARVKARQEIIQRIKKEREVRGKLKREYIQSHAHQNGQFGSLQKILPPKGPRVMTTREMKDLTNKHYQKLPEVQEKKLIEMMEREKQTNRLVSQLYAKRVKQEALRGKVNLGLSKSVIRK